MKQYSRKYTNDYLPLRLKDWDYRNNGIYFVTINTHYKVNYFGEIRDQEMHLNEIGQFAHKFWEEIPKHFHYVELGEFVIMPNHMHGIIIINRPPWMMVEPKFKIISGVGMLQCNIPTPEIKQPLFSPKSLRMSRISPKPGSLSTIIRSYKSVVSKHAHYINPNFKWQSRFYDHIIRNDKAYYNIHRYIKNNPQNW